MTPVSRRELLAGLAGTTVLGPAATRAAAAGTRRTGVDQGTDLAVQLSPDGRRIAMDLVGVLWVLPAPGGPARRLTGDLFDIAQPDWSPDGGTIAFQSYRTGSFDLWAIRPDGSGLRRLTSGPFDHREPRFAPVGERLAFSADLSGSYGIHLLDLADGRITAVADSAAEEYEPAWSPDGRRIAFVVANTRIDVVDLATGGRETAVSVPAGQIIHGPAFTPDGTGLIHQLTVDGRCELWLDGKPVVTGEEVFPFRVSWTAAGEIVYAADGGIRRRRIGATSSHRNPARCSGSAARCCRRTAGRSRSGRSTTSGPCASVSRPGRSPATGGGSPTRPGRRTAATCPTPPTAAASSTSGCAT
jgi:dipeptidyl aminopeptidase/acylaminoacyl peptidase